MSQDPTRRLDLEVERALADALVGLGYRGMIGSMAVGMVADELAKAIAPYVTPAPGADRCRSDTESGQPASNAEGVRPKHKAGIIGPSGDEAPMIDRAKIIHAVCNTDSINPDCSYPDCSCPSTEPKAALAAARELCRQLCNMGWDSDHDAGKLEEISAELSDE